MDITPQQSIRVSIFVKFTVIISFCLLVFFVLTGLMLTNLQEQALREEKETSAETLAKHVADMSASPIKTYALFVLEERLV